MFYGKCTREKVIMTPKWVSEAMITSPATDQLWSHLCGSLLPPLPPRPTLPHRRSCWQLPVAKVPSSLSFCILVPREVCDSV